MQFARPLIAVLTLVLVTVMLMMAHPAGASIAYGSINNFDTVNDTGVECHGFEIEIDGIHSKDITYTFDWNHYGVPKITEDNSDPLNPRVFVRYESAKNPDGSWAAYTAIPSGPIGPTQGHQFTDPTVNFGGEHFGVGFYGNPAGVKYSWLKDDGFGNLVFAGPVNIATPAFVYYPPAPAVPAQVQAVIAPPPPPAPPVLEFGEASWVKETRTVTHNNNPVALRDLVSDDPNDPNDRNWKNGEPDEVEVEWQLFQRDYNSANGGNNGVMKGAPEPLVKGDEVITRRYDFYKYVGPIDAETGEARAAKVDADGIHGTGIYAGVVVVGDYIGAQMAGFDAQGKIGLIDHLQDGEIHVPYPDRRLVVGGTPPVTTTRTGNLPQGMGFDLASGVLSGTPSVTGTFQFTVHSIDAAGGDVAATFTLNILDVGGVSPAHVNVGVAASPSVGGTITGGGDYLAGALVTLRATPKPGYGFFNWTEAGTILSTSRTYQFSADVNRDLVARFVPPPVAPSNLAATSLSPTRIRVTWLDNTTDEAAYRLERSTNAGATYAPAGSVPLAAGAGTTLSFVDKGLAPSTTYTYRVKAVNSAGSAYNTNGPQSATTLGAPAAPSALIATALSTTKISLAWTDNATDEQGFKLERSADGGATWPAAIAVASAGGTGTTVKFLNTRLSPNTTYTYRVRSYNDGAYSAYNANGPQSVTTMAIPAAPSNLSLTGLSPRQIQVKWTDNSSVEQGFRLERSSDGGLTWTRIVTLPPVAGSGATGTFTDLNLTSGATYTYRVRAFNDSYFSAYNANGPQSLTAP